MDWEVFAIVLGGIAGLVGAGGISGFYLALRKWPMERRTAEVTDAATLTKAAAELVNDLSNEINRVRVQYTELESDFREKINILTGFRIDLLDAKERIHKLEEGKIAQARIIANLRNQVSMLQSNGEAKDNMVEELKARIAQMQAYIQNLDENTYG